jgi:ligand-binding sensor domain-containing protein
MMKHMHVYALLMFVFCIPCKGQNKTKPKDDTRSNGAVGTRYEKLNKTQPTGNGLAENVRCGLQDKAGNLWFGTTGHGVFYYDGRSFTNFTVIDGLNNNYVWSIVEDRKGNILIGTGKGVSCYDGKSFTDFTLHQSFGERAIWTLFEDTKGRIWIGTDVNGIYFYDGKSFSPLISRAINESGLTLDNLNGMTEDKAGNLWFASRAGEGISRYDGQTITRFIGINDAMFHCVVEDKSGIIWFGSRQHGVFRYDARLPQGPGNSLTHMSDKNGPGNDCIYSIVEDKSGNLWFTTESNGVYRYDGKSFTNYLMDEGPQPTLKSDLSFAMRELIPYYNSVFTVVVDNAGNLWFGTRNLGLFRYDGKSFVNYSE